ncbi:glycosyltransferase, partial [Dolichospermum sp. ST_sed3]|nr:glycosyltransferase [Dolichospermum sp. ST_sed3]
DYNRYTFLWFGGSGLILKGLDIVLEAFAEMPDFKLYVCGPINKENDFEQLYHNELYNTPNINTIGWIDTNDESFEKILNDCIAIVYPSFSEGTAGSVIQCMHVGLIPIVSVQSGVDIKDFGIQLPKNTKKEIQNAVRKLANTSTSELKAMSLNAWRYARAYHTRDKFEEEYRDFLINRVHI